MPSSGLQKCADRKSTRLNSSHTIISYAVFCLKKKKTQLTPTANTNSSALHPFSIHRVEEQQRGGWYTVVLQDQIVSRSWCCVFVFFFNDPAPPEIYPLSLPAPLPI